MYKLLCNSYVGMNVEICALDCIQKASKFSNFQEMAEEFQKTLRHDDHMYSTDVCTTVPWMEALLTTLTHLENSKYRFV